MNIGHHHSKKFIISFTICMTIYSNYTLNLLYYILVRFYYFLVKIIEGKLIEAQNI